MTSGLSPLVLRRTSREYEEQPGLHLTPVHAHGSMSSPVGAHYRFLREEAP
jgi:hypothetical protein